MHSWDPTKLSNLTIQELHDDIVTMSASEYQHLCARQRRRERGAQDHQNTGRICCGRFLLRLAEESKNPKNPATEQKIDQRSTKHHERIACGSTPA